MLRGVYRVTVNLWLIPETAEVNASSANADFGGSLRSCFWLSSKATREECRKKTLGCRCFSCVRCMNVSGGTSSCAYKTVAQSRWKKKFSLHEHQEEFPLLSSTGRPAFKIRSPQDALEYASAKVDFMVKLIEKYKRSTRNIVIN